MGIPLLSPRRTDGWRAATIDFASPGTLDEKTWDAVDVEVPPKGFITNGSGIYDGTAAVSYDVTDLPVSIDKGHDISGRGVGVNSSGATQTLTIYAEIIDPDGKSRVDNQKTGDVADGDTIKVTTPYVTLDKPGPWQLHCKLSA